LPAVLKGGVRDGLTQRSWLGPCEVTGRGVLQAVEAAKPKATRWECASVAEPSEGGRSWKGGQRHGVGLIMEALMATLTTSAFTLRWEVLWRL
jgi:hypothetical protein